MINEYLVAKGSRLILQGLGVDIENHNFATTPERFAKVMQELFEPPATEWPVFEENYTDIVVLRNHTFYTLCPHHMLPVKLVCSVAYKPKGQVIGASKLARIMHEANRKPETQEKLTDLICTTLHELTGGTSEGEAVYMTGEHGCMKIRGIKTDGDLVTWRFAGCFLEDMEMQRRFFDLVSRSR